LLTIALTEPSDQEDTGAGNKRSNPPDDAQEADDSEPGLVNPLTTDPPAFMSPGNGRICAIRFNILQLERCIGLKDPKFI